jgi:IrrE N-terminal-like domain
MEIPMPNRIVSTPIPTNMKRDDIYHIAEDLRQKVASDIKESPEITVMRSGGRTVEAIFLGGNIRLLAWNAKDWLSTSSFNLSRARRRADAACHIAHVVLHLPQIHSRYGLNSFMEISASQTPETDSEYAQALLEANWFAACLLVPPEALFSIAEYTLQDIKDIAIYYDVPKSLVRMRFALPFS